MTALKKFARLEGPGVWRPAPELQRRNVVVTLGKASLTIADPRSGQALSHWSLPALVRRGTHSEPALYAPSGDEDDELLEIDDLTLIEALEQIRDALKPPPPARWLRRVLGAATVALLVGGVAFLPGAIKRHTAEIVPPATRNQIGRAALEALALSPAGERICSHPAGRQALAALRGRVLGADWRLQVVAGVPGFETTHLPGRIILIGADLLERLDSAEALAGWILAEAVARERHDPLLDVLDYAGLGATITLLTTGEMPAEQLQGYTRSRIDAGRASLPDAQTYRARFDAIGQSPFAFALSLRGFDDVLSQTLREGAGPTTDPLITDGEWLTLQAICTQA